RPLGPPPAGGLAVGRHGEGGLGAVRPRRRGRRQHPRRGRGPALRAAGGRLPPRLPRAVRAPAGAGPALHRDGHHLQ
ncbi:unnamed protein product, partial [Prorocentrum cordatum]